MCNLNPLWKMFAILITMATIFVCICLAYRSGYIDATQKHQREQKEEMINMNEKLTAYREYYHSCENFLDALDSKYDWIHAFDPQEYYESRHIVDTLDSDN